MLKHKITLLTLITGLLIAPAAADLEFRDPDNVSFYTGLEFNGDNQIYGLDEPTASSSPVRLQDIESGYYNLSGDTLQGDLNVGGNSINNFFDSACGEDQAVKDVYNNGTFVCGEAGGSSGLPEVLDSNNTANQFIDMDNYTIRNLGAPEGNLDAVRRQDITGMLNRTNGTLAGTLNFNGYNAELSNGYLSNDGDDEGITVDNSGNVEITGELGLQESPVSNIGTPQDNRDAVRQGQLSNYYNLSGDTLDGNLELGGNEIQDSSGQITLGAGNVNIPDGNLNLNGNNVTSTGNQEICAGDMC